MQSTPGVSVVKMKVQKKVYIFIWKCNGAKHWLLSRENWYRIYASYRCIHQSTFKCQLWNNEQLLSPMVHIILNQECVSHQPPYAYFLTHTLTLSPLTLIHSQPHFLTKWKGLTPIFLAAPPSRLWWWLVDSTLLCAGQQDLNWKNRARQCDLGSRKLY